MNKEYITSTTAKILREIHEEIVKKSRECDCLKDKFESSEWKKVTKIIILQVETTALFRYFIDTLDNLTKEGEE